MATIKVKKQGSKAEGKASVIMYQITNQHKKQRPTTNPHMQSSNRDAKKGELIPCTPNRIIPQRQINKNIN